MEKLLFALLVPLLTFSALQSRKGIKQGLPYAIVGWLVGVVAIYLQTSLAVEGFLKVAVVTAACVACLVFGKWSTKNDRR